MMTRSSESLPDFEIQEVTFRAEQVAHKDRALEAAREGIRARVAIAEKAFKRAQNRSGIEARLLEGGLPPKKVARLKRELDFLRTYETRHPVGEKAVQLHVWIKYGFNFAAVMDSLDITDSEN